MSLKKFISIVSVTMAVVACGNHAEILTFTSDGNDAYVDLGTVQESEGPVHFNIIIPYYGEENVAPLKSSVSCRCLSIDGFDPMESVADKDITVQCTFDPAYRIGQEKEEAYVLFSNKRMLSIHLQVDVVPCKHPIEEDHPYQLGEGLCTSHKLLHFGRFAPGETRDMFFNIANSKDNSVTIAFETRGEVKGSLRLRQPGKVEADWRDTLHVKFTMPSDAQPSDTIRFSLQPVVDGVETVTPIQITAICTNK